VGVDQKAHLELTREIVRKFNNLYGRTFPEPETLLAGTPKLLGIDNRKMSKSFGNFIALSDSPGVIKKKVKSMITDPEKIRMGDAGHPAICNVFSYYEVFAPDEADKMCGECRKGSRGCTACKEKLAEILVRRLEPIQEKRNRLLKGRDRLFDILEKGDKKAKEAASGTMKDVRKKLRLL